MGILGGDGDETFEGGGGPAAGEPFEDLAEGDEDQQHGRRLEIQIAQQENGKLVETHGGHGADLVNFRQGVKIRRQGADGDQGVHTRGERQQPAYALGDQPAVDDEDQRGQQQLHAGEDGGIIRQEGQGQAERHMLRGDVKQEGRQNQRQGEPDQRRAEGRIEALEQRLPPVFVVAGVIHPDDAVAEPLHGFNHVGLAVYAPQFHAVGHQADFAEIYPRDFADGALDMGGARRAVHAGNAV